MLYPLMSSNFALSKVYWLLSCFTDRKPSFRGQVLLQKIALLEQDPLTYSSVLCFQCIPHTQNNSVCKLWFKQQGSPWNGASRDWCAAEQHGYEYRAAALVLAVRGGGGNPS